MLKRLFTLALLIVLVTGWMPMLPAQSQTPAQTEIVLVEASDAAALRDVEASGGVLLAEYETATLWQVPARAERASLRPAVTQVDNSIYLRGVTLQPGRSEPAIPSAMRQSTPSGSALWIIQFAGPVLPEWLEGLQAAGMEIVSYLPNNAFVVWGAQPAARLQALSTEFPVIHWQGAYHPYYRLSPRLRPDQEVQERAEPLGETVDVTVQLYNTPSVGETITRLEDRALKVILPAAPVGNLLNIRVRIPSADLVEIASWAEVLNIESYTAPQLLDEVQGQILAGNITSTSGNMLLPTGPGYLSWLASKGFPINPTLYPLVDVIDDGLDNGTVLPLHSDFFTLGYKPYGTRVIYNHNCTTDASGNGAGGHGNLNAGIMGGYNDQLSPAYKDALGYSYGLGISPYGRIASTKVFSNAGYFELDRCGNSISQLINASYVNGARISSNSWGANVTVGNDYTATSQEFDYLTRDASFASGNQEMLHIVAAGNDGPYQETVGSPGTAKNVLTVGATENVRDQSVKDGCSELNANSAGDMASFSSRGPTMDGRIKPDIVAPGTHVMGPASQDPAFNGSGVCGMYPTSSYYPAGQTLYTWSTGTSHSTPAIAGSAQLSYNYYQRALTANAIPSPAMQKALLLNTPRYLKGTSAYDTLPSNAQGWGMADLGVLTDGTPRILKDQNHVFTASGQTPYTLTGFIADANKPFRVSVVWTDAAGNPSAAIAAVNNLNLEVVVGGQVYKGNVFSKDMSVTGGTFDSLNNVENVFIPEGNDGMFRVRVFPQTIAGNAIPGNAYSYDQDFALVIYNGTEAANLPVLTVNSFNFAQESGNGNGYFDPGETYSVQVSLGNQGTAATGPVTATLISTDPQVKGTNAGAAPAIAVGQTQSIAPHLTIKMTSIHACYGTIPLYVRLTHGPYTHHLRLPDMEIGQPNTVSQTFTAPGLPVAMPLPISYKAISMMIPSGINVNDVNVRVSITHPYVSDLRLVLVNPGSIPITLSDRNGSTGDNYTNTVFDDEAAINIIFGTPPFTGSFRPEAPLSVYDKLPSAGEWKLEVYDEYPTLDDGNITDFKLVFSSNVPVCSIVGTKRTLFIPSVSR